MIYSYKKKKKNVVYFYYFHITMDASGVDLVRFILTDSNQKKDENCALRETVLTLQHEKELIKLELAQARDQVSFK